jgi:carbon monoxide dehydrogenase subunit G
MANYVTTIETPMAPTEAFAYMADLRNFQEWDPGVKSVEQVTGSGAGPDSTFDVTVDSVGSGLTLRYETVEFDEPRLVVAKATSTMLTSLDRITVEPAGTGSLVTYDAELTLNGPLRLADILLRPVFKRVGDRANRGLLRKLGGTQR